MLQQLELVLRPHTQAIAGMKRAHCEVNKSEDDIKQATPDCRWLTMPFGNHLQTESQKQEKNTPPSRTPLPSSKRQKTGVTSSISLLTPSPARLHPPSPLRYQISEILPEAVPFAVHGKPQKPRFRSKTGRRKTGKLLLRKVLAPTVKPLRQLKRKEKKIKIVPAPPPVRAHPPSPLRYQINETPKPIPFTLALTPTKHRNRGRTEPRLLREVLAPVVQPLEEFNFLEDEIEIVNVISQGEHSIIFRIFAGEKFYALKIVSTVSLLSSPYQYPLFQGTLLTLPQHRYERTTVPEFSTYPEPNPFFDAEYSAYARLAPYPSIHGHLTPKCHGFINFSSLPCAPTTPSSPNQPRQPFTSRTDSPALYLDYITQHSTTTPKQIHSSPVWRAYFTTAPAKAPLLRGLVLDDLPLLRVLDPAILDSPSSAYRSIARQGTSKLKDLHACGILHGDLAEENSVLVKIGDGKGNENAEKDGGVGFLFLGFDRAKTVRDFKPSVFRRLARREERVWEGRWECLVVESEEKLKKKRERREKVEKEEKDNKKLVRCAKDT
ncbi:hypothetical protein VTL71DRAFT_6329 [Oculimacula yallundae]|uniref:Protein kinase domain-containing protein n=1 Tax=Oculimacula yallundae TaxID=86028 RepID=A0ABR4BZA8_9HELO